MGGFAFIRPPESTFSFLDSKVGRVYLAHQRRHMEVQTESAAALVPGFCVASLLFYVAYACISLLPGGDPKESLLVRAAPPMLFFVAGLLITFRIAWRLRRPATARASNNTAHQLAECHGGSTSRVRDIGNADGTVFLDGVAPLFRLMR